MKITGFFNISNTEVEQFNIDLEKALYELQKDGQEVEIQYKVNTFPNGQIVYSALLLGRKELTF